MEERIKKKFQTIQSIARIDSEYHAMIRECRILESRYDTVLATLTPEQQDVICDFVSHCEGMSWRMLELACQFMDFPNSNDDEPDNPGTNT